MDYYMILDFAVDFGYELAMCGADTYRIEDSIHRITKSFGVESEVFAIPNDIIVSIITDTGKPITRMRRIKYHGNDMDSLEKLNRLSRVICTDKVSPEEAAGLLVKTKSEFYSHSLPFQLIGYFLGAAGFGIGFGCSYVDAICAGIIGIIVGLLLKVLNYYKVNPFFCTTAGAFVTAVTTCVMTHLGISNHPDSVIIGALMMLVPGLLFTNSMRDIIYGDINSGINRFVQVMLTAVAISVGIAAGWSMSVELMGEPTVAPAVNSTYIMLFISNYLACFGFAVQFNIKGLGAYLCALGGLITWFVYYALISSGAHMLVANFWAACAAALYSEIMARVRRCPVPPYLVLAIFPLIPGAGIYYTMSYALQKDIELFVEQGLATAAIAGVISVAILLVSSVFRIQMVHKILKA